MKNIMEGERCMNNLGNSGVSCTNIIGYLTGYPDQIWYDPRQISNILSMALVEKHLLIIYGKEICFIVNKDGGNKCHFFIPEQRPYYLDTEVIKTHKNKETNDDDIMINKKQ